MQKKRLIPSQHDALGMNISSEPFPPQTKPILLFLSYSRSSGGTFAKTYNVTPPHPSHTLISLNLTGIVEFHAITPKGCELIVKLDKPSI